MGTSQQFKTYPENIYNDIFDQLSEEDSGSSFRVTKSKP